MPGRNEDCWCGSGRKYKHCHYQIDMAAEHQKYAAAQDVYARNWVGTAQHNYEDNVYHWLAEALAGYSPKRILDVGCGSGHGLVALREVLGPDTQIVALDENRSCLRTARNTLRKHGIDATIVERMAVSSGPGGYDHVADPLTIDPAAPCVLIEADVCNDPHLLTALQASDPFDAVTVWLSGVHMMRQFNVKVRERGVDSDGAHRLYVQNATYELADTVLRPGGVLQVGDRGQTPDTPLLRDDTLRAHADQASVTSLRVQGLTYRPYDLPDQRRTPMVFTLGQAGLIPTSFTVAITSVISEKPK